MWSSLALGLLCSSLVSTWAWVETDRPDFGSAGAGSVKDWANFRIKWAEEQFAATGWQRAGSPGFWPGEIVYQIQVDRFNNGNKTNDLFNLKEDQVRNMNSNDLYGIQDWRHGGDLEGIRKRIGYFKDLGITALWITPILKHDGSYHGYCLTDPSEIDPGFGTREEFRQLVKECHDNGIKVVLDIVVNHLCDPKSYYTNQPNHVQCAADLNSKFWAGVGGGSASQGGMSFSSGFFGPLKSPYFFNRCGPNSYAEMSGQGPEAVYGDFVQGMFDFDTTNWDFQEIFTKMMLFWIAYADIDGFRLDAAKHVTEDFTAYISTISRDYALSLGKNDFLVIGEVAASADWIGRRVGRMYSNPKNLDDHGNMPLGAINRMKSIQSVFLKHPKFPYPGLTSGYDFNESGRSRDVFLGKVAPTTLEQYFKSDEFLTVLGQTDVRYSWTIMEIHDWPRFLESVPFDWGRAQMALAYLLTMQGTPVIYYGLEQGFNGNCNFDNIKVGNAWDSVRGSCSSNDDSRKRQDMFMAGPYRLRSAVATIDSLSYIGKVGDWGIVEDWRVDPMLRRDHDLYLLTKKLLRIRKSCGPLNWGVTAFRWVDFSPEGLIAFSRFDGVYEVVVVINMKYNAIGLPSKLAIDNALNPNYLDGQKYKNLFNDQQFGYIGRENGQAFLYFSGSNTMIGGRAVMILVHESRIGLYDNDAQITLCRNN